MESTLHRRTTAPVAPSDAAATALRPLPLSGARVTGGLWARQQQVNREVAIPAGWQRLGESGAFRNLRRAAGREAGPHEGPVFIDSDVYKWLEAVAWEQARTPSQTLADQQAEVTALIGAAQRPDGYLNSFVQVAGAADARFSDLTSGHELYCAGHLMQAAVAQHRATGQRELIEVAVRFADLLDGTFGPGKRPGLDGHPLVETALAELYRETGTARYLELARYFVDARGHGRVVAGPHPAQARPASYYCDRVPVRAADTVEGHAVRALYLAAGATDVAVETGDEELLGALRRQWDAMTATKTYVTGGLGARWDGEAFGAPYELPADRAYCETCAAIASIQWSWRLLLATGDARYADLIERTLYNAMLPGISADGSAYFYANALQVRSGAADDEPRNPANGRAGWFDVACCPPNIMRTLSSLGTLLATYDDDGIQVHQYAAAAIAAGLPAGEAELAVATDYPWDGRVAVTVVSAPDRDWTLSLRVPAWCAGARARADPDGVTAAAEPGTYLRLRRRWTPGTTVVLDLRMPVRRTAAHPRVDAVRGCVAIERGPLVYCLEQADQPAGVLVDDAQVTGGECEAAWDPDLLGGMTVVRLPGRTAGSYADLHLTAVPYFAWANRGPGPMRVWIPVATAG